MAAPAYSTDLTDITTAFTTTDWSLISEGGGGQNSLTAPETDDFIQGTNAVSRNPFSSSIRGIIYDRATITVATDDAVFHWWKADIAQALDTFAGGGVHLVHGISSTAYKKFYVAGSDTYELGGWRCTPIDPTATSSLDRGTPGTPDYDTFGIAFDVPSTGPSKGFPFKHDMIRHGRSIDVIDGEVADAASWDSLTTYADEITRRWGIAQGTDTGATVQGIVNWGTSGDAVYSRVSGGTIVFTDTLGFVIDGFTRILFANASTDLEWTGVTFVALGTDNRGLFLVDSATDPPCIFTACRFIDIDTFGAEANTDLIGCTFDSMNEVTVKGGSVVGSSFLTPTVATDSAALIYNETADPDGEFDDTEFTMGAADHHAIEFGTSAPTAITLRGITLSGFSASDDLDDSAYNFLRTSGTTTLSIVGGSGTPSVQVTGSHTVTVIQDPVTLALTVLEQDGTPIENARVLVRAGATGNIPYLDSVTISRVTTTATVAHTAHGMLDGQKVKITGAVQPEYNGIKTITNVVTNAYDYTVSGSPTTPATGTIISTGVIISGLTDSSGEISDTRVYSADQEIDSTRSHARKSSAADDPKFQTSPISGTIISASGLTANVLMIPDQ